MGVYYTVMMYMQQLVALFLKHCSGNIWRFRVFGMVDRLVKLSMGCFRMYIAYIKCSIQFKEYRAVGEHQSRLFPQNDDMYDKGFLEIGR